MMLTMMLAIDAFYFLTAFISAIKYGSFTKVHWTVKKLHLLYLLLFGTFTGQNNIIL